MERKYKYILGLILLMTAVLCGCSSDTEKNTGNSASLQNTAGDELILLSDTDVRWNGEKLGEKESAVYLSHDIIYYEDRDCYESGNPYGEGEKEDSHSAQEAQAHTVVNITQAGTYRIQGKLSQGQIRVDLGEDANEDPEAVVTLILDGVDVTCEVAPAILFMNVYECDHDWDEEDAQAEVDTSTAGANLVIADDSENRVNGSYVAKIYKDNEDGKKLWKQDGAVYSYMSMNVDGEEKGTGLLNITAENEGLDTELHLTINGGKIRIYSQDDGINTNEDGVSVTTINGGDVHIIAGLGKEGDGIDSNGWLVINGGTVIASAHPASDAGLDSDMGSYVHGGTVVALGSTMDWAESDSRQVTMNLQFADYKDSRDAIVVKDPETERIVFAYDPSEDEVLGDNTRSYMGAVISCAEFAVDDTYEIYTGGELAGTETGGVYEAASVTAYENGIRQGYTGTDVRGHFGGVRPELPGGEPLKDGERPQMPGGEPPKGGERPELPKGEMPKDGEHPQMPEGEKYENAGVLREMQFQFYMQDKVNNFSGVADEKEI